MLQQREGGGQRLQGHHPRGMVGTGEAADRVPVVTSKGPYLLLSLA